MPWGAGAKGSTATLWRDKTLMGKQVTGSIDVKTPAPTVQKTEMKPDAEGNQKQQAQIQPAASSGPVRQTAPPVQKAQTQRPVTSTTTATDTAPAPRFAKCFITLKFEFALTAYAIKDFLALKDSFNCVY